MYNLIERVYETGEFTTSKFILLEHASYDACKNAIEKAIIRHTTGNFLSVHVDDKITEGTISLFTVDRDGSGTVYTLQIVEA